MIKVSVVAIICKCLIIPNLVAYSFGKIFVSHVLDNLKNVMSKCMNQPLLIGHFRVPKTLTFQHEAKCKNFVVKISFICMRIKNNFHINGSAFRLVATWKWPIKR